MITDVDTLDLFEVENGSFILSGEKKDREHKIFSSRISNTLLYIQIMTVIDQKQRVELELLVFLEGWNLKNLDAWKTERKNFIEKIFPLTEK